MSRARSPWLRAGAIALGLLLVPAIGLVAFCPGPSSRVPSSTPTQSRPVARPVDEQRPGSLPKSREDRPASTKTSPVVNEWAVEGEVETPDGKPAAEAQVACTDKELATKTDELGRFHFGEDALGCRAVAKKTGFAPSDETKLAASGNRLRLVTSSGVAGNVVDENNAAIPTFWVGLEPASPLEDGGVLPSAHVDNIDGNFEILDVPPGHYTVIASSAGHPLQRFDAVDVAAGAVVRGIKVALKKGGTLTGKVTDAFSGSPLAGAFVYVDGTVNKHIVAPSAIAGPNGEYTIDGTPFDGFALRVFRPGFIETLVPDLKVPPGASATRDVLLKPQGR